MKTLDPDKLKRRAKDCGISQSELARRAGMTGAGLTNALQHRNPTVKTLSRLAEVLGVEIEDLLSEDPPEDQHALAM